MANLRAQPLPEPKTTPVFLSKDVPATASQVLAGRGITLGGGLSSRPSVDATGNEIVWRESWSGMDERGGRHVSYRQHLINRYAEAEIFGSGVGLHYSAAGKLWSLGGRQFDSAKPSNVPVFSAEEAIDRVVLRLETHPGFEPEALSDITAEMRAGRTKRTELKLVQIRDLFRYAYFTFANDSRGIPYDVVIDAETEEILSVTPYIRGGNCLPPTVLNRVNAIGSPVRASGDRMLLANQTGDRAPFTHEGYWQLVPNLSVSQQTDNPDFACNRIVPGYSLFPLMTESGTPVYRRDPSYEWEGNAAGDALYHTDRTMQGLSMLGRNGWNGFWGDANIVIQTTALPADNPGFLREPPPGDNRFPPTSCVIIAPAFYMYNLAAALDIIAHEWGHGVIYTSSANFNRTRVGLELDEGFSDVIGQAVEKLRQPVECSGLECSSDWHIGEDAAGTGTSINFTYLRSGEQDDDADGEPGHFWVGPNGFDPKGYNDRLHAGDTSSGDSVHEYGNMLNVVFYLLTEGGYNPICGRLGHLEGCNTGAIALGLTKASKILFDTVQFYAQPNARWEDLATYATYAAFDLYSDCEAGNAAYVEQAAVYFAFKGIGYPRETPREECP